MRYCCGLHLTTRPPTPASLMTRSEPRPEEHQGHLPGAREAHDGPQLEQVAHLREQVRGTADAHRREACQRLLARRLDAQPALDVGAQAERLLLGQPPDERRRGHASALESRSMTSAAGSGRRSAEGQQQVAR